MHEEKLARFIADWLEEKSQESKGGSPYVDTDDLDSCVVDGNIDLLELSRRILAAKFICEIDTTAHDTPEGTESLNLGVAIELCLDPQHAQYGQPRESCYICSSDRKEHD